VISTKSNVTFLAHIEANMKILWRPAPYKMQEAVTEIMMI